MIVPIKPPWKDMPPFQISSARIGLASTLCEIVEQDIADAAAADDAERDPEQEVVEMRLGDGAASLRQSVPLRTSRRA